MSKPSSDPKVIAIDNLERRVFWYSLIVMLGLAAAAVGASLLLSATQKSLNQVDDLSERVQGLADRSPSEPAKT